MKKELLQYYAGIIDSEGYFQLRYYHNSSNRINGLQFKLEMCDENIITFLANHYNVKVNTSDRGLNRQVIYSFILGPNTNLFKFCQDFIPYLNEKRRQAQLILDYNSLERGLKVSMSKHYANIFAIEKQHPSTEDINFSYPYLAGIMDGDGFFGIKQSGQNNMVLYCGLEQCYRHLAEYLYNTFNTGSLTVRPGRKENHREMYSWTAQGLEEVNKIIQQFSPYVLSKLEKVTQCETLYNLKKALNDFYIHHHKVYKKPMKRK